MHFHARLLLAALTLLLVPAGASATQVIALELDEMVDASDVVVWGEVVSVVSERMPEAAGRFHTLVTVQPYEVVLSDAEHLPGEPITVSVPGGRIGRFAQWVPGAPRFEVGQEVVLLTSRQPASRRLKIVGLALGRYVVDRSTGLPTVEAVSDRTGLDLIRRGPAGRLTPAPAARTDRQPLELLLDAIRARVAARGK